MMGSQVPSFTIQATDGKARSGILKTRHGSISTPATLLYTRRGNCFTMTPDLVRQFQPPTQGYQLDALQFLMNPAPETIAKHGGGAHGYLALDPELPVVVTQRDPTMYEYGNNPNTEKGAYATIHAGAVTVTPASYMAVVKALQPDLWVTLCDEIMGDSSIKRVKVSVERSSRWFNSCIEAADEELASHALAAVVGSGVPAERTRSAQAVADKPVAGFALCGFSTGEDKAAWPALLQASIEPLPDSKPRFISGLSTPLEVLQGIAQGVDVFDNGYVSQSSSLGYALSFAVNPDQATAEAADGGCEAGADATKINLWSVAYRRDKGPLLAGCTCYTCKTHSRAYIHHLLQANEMLAEVLLDVHNTHHYQLFMSQIRKAVSAGQLQQYSEWFSSRVGAAGEALGVNHEHPSARGTKRWSQQPAGDKPSKRPTPA